MREQWGSRAGFVLAAVGSAIGLGNIWRFPYMAYENGGGAFLIPYIFAMLTAGIPFMILEFSVGHRFRGSAPKALGMVSRKMEWLGWWQVLVAYVISVYYVAVIGWTISYFGFAFNQGWGADPKAFFFGEYLKLSGGPFEFGSVQWPIFSATLFAWGLTWFVVSRGVKGGIERANKFFMPTLFLMVLLIAGRAVFLPGAANGLEWLFRPDFSKLADPGVWTAAYGQIFFSLSIGFAIMIAYSSYLPEKSDINNNAFMTVFMNCGFSMLAGIMIFSVLGYMAAEEGKAVQDVVSAGVGLAFITIPKAINMLPAPAFFGTLFFLCLMFAGLSSMISICEAGVAAFMDKFGWSRFQTASILCGTGFAVSIVFTTSSGLYILDIVDHFINNYGVLGAGFVEIVMLSLICRRLEEQRQHVNSVSDFKVGQWWKFCLWGVTPLVLGYNSVMNLVTDITAPYEGYPTVALVSLGWLIVLAIIPMGMMLQMLRGENEFYGRR